MIETDRYSPAVQETIERHRWFWNGTGPSLILIPREERDLYDLDGYEQRFHDPPSMLRAEADRARAIVGWPTDGIPTVRPNLGTVFVPACIGQSYRLRSGSMPWPGEPLTRDAIRSLRDTDLGRAQLMGYARDFYRRAAREPDLYAYHADTQGVFDIAHLLYGTELFAEMLLDEARPWVTELLDCALEWYVEATRMLKEAIGEPDSEMVHGHGTEQGLYFPRAGARISEDTATLLSPELIERDLLPYMQRSVEPFGGGFVHFCGQHGPLLRLLCEQPWCRALDLGNPEAYELDALLDICAATGTVLYSRISALPGESPVRYAVRIGRAVREHRARAVIRSVVVPSSRDEAREMLQEFHEQTTV